VSCKIDNIDYLSIALSNSAGLVYHQNACRHNLYTVTKAILKVKFFFAWTKIFNDCNHFYADKVLLNTSKAIEHLPTVCVCRVFHYRTKGRPALRESSKLKCKVIKITDIVACTFKMPSVGIRTEWCFGCKKSCNSAILYFDHVDFVWENRYLPCYVSCCCFYFVKYG